MGIGKTGGRMKNDFVILFFMFYLLLFVIFINRNQTEPKIEEFDPFKNAAEIKTKIWYDPDTKKELAAHSIVTKTYKKFLWWKKVINEGYDYDIEFTIPLKLSNGNLISSTIELPYYIEE